MMGLNGIYGILWWFNGILWDFFCAGLMEFYEIYPLGNVYKKLWVKSPC